MFPFYIDANDIENQAATLSDIGLLYALLGNASTATTFTLHAQSLIHRVKSDQLYNANLVNWVAIRRLQGDETDRLEEEIKTWAEHHFQSTTLWHLEIVVTNIPLI